MSQPVTIKRGTLLPQAQRITTVFTPTGGWEKTLDFNGAGQDQMIALAYDYIRAGCSVQIVEENDKASLVVTDGTNQFTLDTWEIVGNDLTLDIFQLPSLTIFATGNQIASMRDFVTNFPVGTIADVIQTFLDTALFAAWTTDQKTLAYQVILLYIRGTTDYPYAQYVVRHTTNASNRWQQNISDFGVNSCYTPAQAFTEFQDSALWALPMPARLVYKLANIPTPDFQPNYQWGYRKLPSTEGTAANNRISIVQEMQLYQWSTILVPPY